MTKTLVWRCKKGISLNREIPKSSLLYSRYGLFLFKQCLKLVPGDLFFLQKQGCRCVQDVAVVQDDGFGLIVALVHDSLDFRIDLACHVLAITLGVAVVAAQKDFLVGIVADQTKLVGHAVLGDHGAGHSRSLLDILGSAGGNIVKNQFLGDTAS